MINEIEDINLIENIKKYNDEESLKMLVEKHSGLCNSLYKKYSGPLQASGICLDDIIKEKDYIVYKSALSFDKTKKSKFSTWLYNQVRFQCLNSINENGHYIALENDKLNFLIEKRADYRDDSLKNLNQYIFNIIDSCADKRIEKIFKLRYMSGENKKMSWNKIAKKLKISTQTAINIHNKTLKLLKNKIESKNCFDKI
jgi:RNA polymerase sigma factor (sigma-70 family)